MVLSGQISSTCLKEPLLAGNVGVVIALKAALTTVSNPVLERLRGPFSCSWEPVKSQIILSFLISTLSFRGKGPLPKPSFSIHPVFSYTPVEFWPAQQGLYALRIP